MLFSVREHAWPNVPSVTVAAAEVKLVVLVDEPGRIEGNPAGVHVPAVDVLRQHRRADIGADGAADLPQSLYREGWRQAATRSQLYCQLRIPQSF